MQYDGRFNMKQAHAVIDISQLQFSWQTGLPLVLDIEELQVQAGEKVFIRGPSGSGKSTLLSLLAGVLTPQQGNIQVLGESLTALRPSQRDAFRASHIGFIFQMFNLLPYLSVLDNVTLPLHFSALRRKRVVNAGEEALRLLSHLDLADHALLDRPVTELSVGQQQRVAAARALIGRPELVIADEPTSALDTDRREAFIRLLLNECDTAGSTLLFVSHDTSLQTFFDHSIALDELNHASNLQTL